MLDSWNQSIFNEIKDRLQNAAMRLVGAERNGEAFDSQLVIGVRESYGKEQCMINKGCLFKIYVIYFLSIEFMYKYICLLFYLTM